MGELINNRYCIVCVISWFRELLIRCCLCDVIREGSKAHSGGKTKFHFKNEKKQEHRSKQASTQRSDQQNVATSSSSVDGDEQDVPQPKRLKLLKNTEPLTVGTTSQATAVDVDDHDSLSPSQRLAEIDEKEQEPGPDPDDGDTSLYLAVVIADEIESQSDEDDEAARELTEQDDRAPHRPAAGATSSKPKAEEAKSTEDIDDRSKRLLGMPLSEAKTKWMSAFKNKATATVFRHLCRDFAVKTDGVFRDFFGREARTLGYFTNDYVVISYPWFASVVFLVAATRRVLRSRQWGACA